MENINATMPAWEEKAEFNRFGIISILLMVVGIMGGLAVGMGVINYTGLLILVVISTMLCLSLILSVAPMRYILYTAAFSLILDTILLTYFLIT